MPRGTHVRQVGGRAAVPRIFGLKSPLQSSKLLRTPKSFWSCGLHLLILTLLEIKTEEFKKNCIIIYFKITIANPFQVCIDDTFSEK